MEDWGGSGGYLGNLENFEFFYWGYNFIGLKNKFFDISYLGSFFF